MTSKQLLNEECRNLMSEITRECRRVEYDFNVQRTYFESSKHLLNAKQLEVKRNALRRYLNTLKKIKPGGLF